MIKRGNVSVRPLGTAEHRATIDTMRSNEIVSVVAHPNRPKALLFTTEGGQPIGYVTAQHSLAKEVAAGRIVVFARFTGNRDDGITIRVQVGNPGETVSKYTLEWHAKVMEHPFGVPRESKAYRQNIVGESYRQPAISRSRVGETVSLVHDSGNQYDPNAIAVINTHGEQIGFLPRGGWLTRALLDEGQTCTATIAELHRPMTGRPHAAVVLEVVLGG